MPRNVLVIAEAGVNHNGSLDLALQMVDAAADAGADAVKFQTFTAQNLVSVTAPKASYQKQSTDPDESQFEMLKSLEISVEDHLALMQACDKRAIAFLSSAFDHQSLALLNGTLGLSSIKFGSGELTNAPLLYDAARRGCEIMISSGMAGLGEIEKALQVLALGYGDNAPDLPQPEDFVAAWADPERRSALRERVTLFHCTSQYPAPFNAVNLRAMNTIKAAFGVNIGYSDHTSGTIVSVAAVARGATAIEKHFTLAKNMPGPDHAASLEPDELKQMVDDIRCVSSALGYPVKNIAPCEFDTALVAKKSIVAATNIEIGDRFSEQNLTIKRPGTGMTPDKYWMLLNQHATSSYEMDDLIKEDG